MLNLLDLLTNHFQLFEHVRRSDNIVQAVEREPDQKNEADKLRLIGEDG